MGDLGSRLRFKKDEEDDWTKIEDKVLRKKIQDRLAKRKSRSKTHQSSHTQPATSRETIPADAGTTPNQRTNAATEAQAIITDAAQVRRPANLSTSKQLSTFLVSIAITASQTTLFDFHYLHLSQYNLYRAMLVNANILALNFKDFENEESLSPWTEAHPYPSLSNHALVPTPSQLSVPHHPFIDVIAPPSFRTRVIEAHLSDEDEDNLCWNLHQGGFNVWGEHGWDADGWEISQAFIDRWPQLVDDTVIQQSNVWRARRGENPLQAPRPTTQSDPRFLELT